MVSGRPGRPEAMAYFDRAVHEAHGGRVQEIVDAKKTGAKMIGTFCIYVPDEIILAAGAIPVALCGGTAFSIPYAERLFPRDICPLVKSTLGLAFSKTCPFAPIKDMAVGETTCDAKKKTWDILAGKVNFHVLELPQKKNDATRDLWRREVGAFKERVEGLTGRRIEAAARGEAIRVVNRKRRLLADLAEVRRAARPPLSGTDALVVSQVALVDEPVRFSKALEALLGELRERVRAGVSPFPQGAPRVLVAGCPSVMGNYKIHHAIETSGGAVVADESCTGSRYFEHLVDEADGSVERQVGAIADRYLQIDCSCFTPNDERIARVVEMAGECRADAVVQYTLQYCHTYNIEAVRVAGALKKAGIPSLQVETDYAEEDTGQLATRIEALLEGLAPGGRKG
jgi:benzoyl-CoA reductase/2-hydroxyglutaryl-CoA dehydratase subunit BcrC/BadD/HgdB